MLDGDEYESLCCQCSEYLTLLGGKQGINSQLPPDSKYPLP